MHHYFHNQDFQILSSSPTSSRLLLFKINFFLSITGSTRENAQRSSLKYIKKMQESLVGFIPHCKPKQTVVLPLAIQTNFFTLVTPSPSPGEDLLRQENKDKQNSFQNSPHREKTFLQMVACFQSLSFSRSVGLYPSSNRVASEIP